MPAHNKVELTGNIVARDAEQEGKRPGRFRMSTYCSGSRDKDNLRVAYMTVNQFDMDIAQFTKGTRVKVVGRFDVYENSEGVQVLSVMVQPDYEPDHGIWVVQAADAEAPRQAPQRRAAPPRQEPSFEDDPF